MMNSTNKIEDGIKDPLTDRTKGSCSVLGPIFRVVMVYALAIQLLAGCYRFSGVSIPDEVNTFYIPEFDISNRALKAPRQLGVVFSDQLKQQILRESRLNFTEIDPDIEFSGEITRFSVSSVAPQPDETTAFSRLDITVRVNYVDHLNEDNNWEKSFSDFRNFESNQNFLDVQDGLINQIFKQIGEDIFNQTFSNW